MKIWPAFQLNDPVMVSDKRLVELFGLRGFVIGVNPEEIGEYDTDENRIYIVDLDGIPYDFYGEQLSHWT